MHSWLSLSALLITAACSGSVAPSGFSRTHDLPGGVTFHYPDGFEAADNGQGAIMLTPSDLLMVGDMQAEMMVVAGEPGSVASVDDASVRAQGMQFTQAFPHMSVEGDGEVVEVDGHRVLQMHFRGAFGEHRMAACYQALLVEPFVVTVFTMSTEERFEDRLSTMTQVLGTVTYEQPDCDPRLVGSWRHEDIYLSGSFSSTTVRNLVLRQNGLCFDGGRMMAGMEHSDSAGNATGSSSGGVDGAERQGCWHTDGDRVVLVWQGGTSENWGFYLEDGKMLWTSGDSKKLWKRTN